MSHAIQGTGVMWFRRDLRITDNPALIAAAQHDHLICLFILDPVLIDGDRRCPSRQRYLRQALEDLHTQLISLGSSLTVQEGSPSAVFTELLAQTPIVQVHLAESFTPYTVAQDDEVRRVLSGADVPLIEHGGTTMVPPRRLTTQSGTPFHVFTPFHKAWQRHGCGDPLPPPTALPPSLDAVTTIPIGDVVGRLSTLDAELPPSVWPDGGERPARERADQWLTSTNVSAYDGTRDLLADCAGTSRLSADLHYGTLSTREVWNRLDRRNAGQATYAKELVWRDFYLHVLDRWPETLSTEFREKYRSLPWVDDDESFVAWKEGRTGFPVIDAAMRQLRETGWMHNRARMIVASFLCKDLLLDWRLGERYFINHLVDGDAASNVGGWQWAAGVGTDAQPFFRIFNPTAQGKKHDPDGEYVRRYVPELRSVPAGQIHEPWKLSAMEQTMYHVQIPDDYPSPIIDHAEARQRALSWWNEHAVQQ